MAKQVSLLSFLKIPSEDPMPSTGASPIIVLDTESEEEDNKGEEEEGDKDIESNAEEGEQEDLSPENIIIIDLEGKEETPDHAFTTP